MEDMENEEKEKGNREKEKAVRTSEEKGEVYNFEREQQLRQGKKLRLSGDRQGTPPRTISASIVRIPLRKLQRC